MPPPPQYGGMGVKRTSGPSIAPPLKAARMGDGGEGWVCGKCSNVNFENRAYCNMRKCGAPGPWSCPGCGNKNFAGRDVCNKRSCNHPRPPPPAGTGPQGQQSMQMGPQGGASQQAVFQAVSMLQASGLANLPGVQEGLHQIISATQQIGGQGGGCGHHVRQPAQQGQIMDGSWVCLGCGNINFPNRTTCNAKLCAKPRAEVDGGPPKPGASTKSIFMPGSWVCAACNNINWPKRETCGLQKCGRSRAEVDAGPPTPQQLHDQAIAPPQHMPGGMEPMGGGGGRPAPEGSWPCDACGNVNYPNREECNKRGCGKPRYG